MNTEALNPKLSTLNMFRDIGILGLGDAKLPGVS